ncbi:DNA cytosine methyltransferase [Paenibacillaceae bacterium]|nr:DNA cytosine methyltransferase [Paenibacillaceae bacterium]
MTSEILYQFNGKPTYNGQRIYIDRSALTQAGFGPGQRFDTVSDPDNNLIEFKIHNTGSNKVSKKTRKKSIVPVIDKSGHEIRSALEGCDEIKITFFNERVLIKGIKKTAATIKENEITNEKLKSITFCAGAGISTESMKQAGFDEVAAVEWNPKEGSEDKFSNIYSVNHPDSVMFNLPMQMLSGTDLPYADVWLATLDCTDYSKASNGTKKEYHTMHLYMHLMRLFWERRKEDRPSAILIENVPEFEKTAGNSLKLCFEEEGFFMKMGKLNSLDYGSRTKRERFFMVASVYEGFSFPTPIRKKINSIAADGVLSIDELKWMTAEESGTLSYFLEREKKAMTHNHRMTLFDITKDSFIGTITKSHHKIQPENWIKHPTNPNLFAYLTGEQIRKLHGIDKNYYLGDSNKLIVESIGQGVCIQTFDTLTKELFKFLQKYLMTDQIYAS